MRLRRRLRAGPSYRWRYSGRTPERLLIAPPDLRLADAQVARDIYHGRFLLGGQLVETGGQSPFQMQAGNPAWQESLHGFRWLRHMRAAESELAAANARALVEDWIATYGKRVSSPPWEPAIAARRVISWLQHSSVVLQGAELPFYRLFLKNLAVQMRYLRAMASEMPDGEDRLRARVALALCALSLPTPATALRTASRNLAFELERQILADGGHVSRNPRAVLELLADLLPLRQTYTNQSEQPPQALVEAVERMLPALRFFRHRDGSIARFNGMGITLYDRVAAILRYDDTDGAPLLHAPHSGYERLALGGTTVLADAAAPPPPDLSHFAHAGCLSFEMSSGRHQFIVNSGVDSFGDDSFRPLARTTAAHSTVTLNDTSQARFSLSSQWNGLIGTPLLSGPRRVACRRDDGEGVHRFVASHDGYAARFGLMHERELALSQNGILLEGTDRVCRPDGSRARAVGGDAVAVRFHVHPDIDIYRDPEGRLILTGEATDTWLFTAESAAPVVEESIFFAGLGGPRRSRQIVLYAAASEQSEIHWRLQKTHAINGDG
ncbi:heparinase II/III family protein [Nitratireductor pacificus]|uniref:Heparinase II/III-like protein n=1 Tax=Nitratireductor pacificus pht-3B TaxID=391937 RepID=K2N4Q1_9HYPH|nr:heparinase II/III family protein [Nitratireductor pacificus]EKF19148.1 heparinase II/III-like protein [Nitratireductor pacificus pht-3B]